MRRSLAGLLLLLAAGCVVEGDSASPSSEPCTLTPSMQRTGALSWGVSFETPIPSIASVSYGAIDANGDSAMGWYVRDGSTPRKHHQLNILGLPPDQSYQFVARALRTDGVSCASEPDQIPAVHALPLPTGTLTAFDSIEVVTRVRSPLPDRIEPSTIVATNLLFGSSMTLSQAVIWDRFGRPVWTGIASETVGQSSGDVSVTVTDDDPHAYSSDNQRGLLIGGGVPAGTPVVELGLDHSRIREGQEQPSVLGREGYMHHTAAKLGEDLYLTLSTELSSGAPSDWIVAHGPAFDPRVGDPRDDVIWEVLLSEVLGEPFYFGNSTTYEASTHTVHHNLHDRNIVLAIDVDEARIEWAFGQDAATLALDDNAVVFDRIDDDGGNPEPWFDGAHGVKVYTHDDDEPTQRRVLMHDNGAQDSGGTHRGYTRAVEYRLDLERGSVELLWAYPPSRPVSGDDPPLWCNARFGNIERIGDNVLLVSGSPSPDGYADAPARSLLLELEPDLDRHSANLVWMMELQAPEGATGPMPSFYSGVPVRGLRGRYEDEVLPGNADWASSSFVFSGLVKRDW